MNSAYMQACVSQYNDVLRAGKMKVNGVLLEWTSTSSTDTIGSMYSFRDTIFACERVPSVWREEELDELLYCIMKALSFQFALMDVLKALEKELGTGSLPSLENEGLQYSVELKEAGCTAKVEWTKPAKIYTLDPASIECDKLLCGTIKRLFTQFVFPVAVQQPLQYKVEMVAPRRIMMLLRRQMHKDIGVTVVAPLVPPAAVEGRSTSSVLDDGRCKLPFCNRLVARSYDACCRTCAASEGMRHGPICEARQVKDRESSIRQGLAYESSDTGSLHGDVGSCTEEELELSLEITGERSELANI